MSFDASFGFGFTSHRIALILAGIALSVAAPSASQAASSTTTSLTTGTTTVVYGETVSLTARVASVARGAPTGTVTFKEGNRVLGTLGLRESVGGHSLTSGDFHNCFINDARKVACWGINQNGQLGDGTTKSRGWTPTEVLNLPAVSAVSAGTEHSCALTVWGEVKCWGWNYFGQLGDGTKTNRLTPITVKGLRGVTAIANGGDHTCAVVNTGAVECWGRNYYGQLGDGSRTDRSVPVSVPGVTGVVALSGGFAHTCAVTRSGIVKCWGANYSCQIGDGSCEDRLRPITVPNVAGVVAVSAGGEHTCALLSSGQLKCWGSGTDDQLGLGTSSIESTPVLVPNLSGVVSIAAGARHTVATTKTDEVKFWGTMRADVPYDDPIHSATPATYGWSTSSAISAGRAYFCRETTSKGALSCMGLDMYGHRLDGNLGFVTGISQSGANLFPVGLSVGQHVVSASYAGDTLHTSSAAPTRTIIVTKGATQTAATASQTTLPIGRSLTLTAAVSAKAPAAGTASGKVRFLDGTRLLATVPLVGAKASLATSTLAAGTHTITMVYDGDANFLASTSAAVTVTVTKASLATAAE